MHFFKVISLVGRRIHGGTAWLCCSWEVREIMQIKEIVWTKTISLSMVWTFSNVVVVFGLQRSVGEHIFFFKHTNGGCILFRVYVDYSALTGDDARGIDALKSFLQAGFHSMDLGMIFSFLGIEVTRSKK